MKLCMDHRFWPGAVLSRRLSGIRKKKWAEGRVRGLRAGIIYPTVHCDSLCKRACMSVGMGYISCGCMFYHDDEKIRQNNMISRLVEQHVGKL
jgi:hypothetical protein